MRTSTTFEAELLALLDAPLLHAGYYIVQLRLADGHRKKSLQITAERKDDAPMTVEDCEAISTTASALLDVDDPIAREYDLEVSSPGLERPLTVIEDFEHYKGEPIAVEMLQAQQGRRKFKGIATKVADGQVILEQDGQAYTLPFVQMKQAHLVETEEMIRALLNASM